MKNRITASSLMPSVIPFEAEDELPFEEKIATYLQMDFGCHSGETDYLEYIKSLSADGD